MLLLEKIRENIDLVTNMVSGLEMLIGLALLVGGIMVSAVRKMISCYAFLLSNNIEMIFMYKKERVKLNVASSFMYVSSLILLSLLNSKYAKLMAVSERVLEICAIILFVLSVTLIAIIVMLLGGTFAKKMQEIRICRFLWSLSKRLLCKIIKNIGKIMGSVRNIGKKIVKTIMAWRNAINTCAGYIKIREFFKAEWNKCGTNIEKDNKRKFTTNQKLRIMGFILATVWGIIFSYLAAILVDGQKAYLLGIIGIIFITYVALIFLGHRIEPYEAKVYYEVEDKNVFIYYRIDEEHCVGGDAHVWSQCNTRFYIPFKELEMHDLYPISKRIQENANMKNL